MPLLCSPGRLCDAHKDGAAGPEDRCPYYCDADGCDQEAIVEIGPDGATYCRWHADDPDDLPEGEDVAEPDWNGHRIAFGLNGRLGTYHESVKLYDDNTSSLVWES